MTNDPTSNLEINLFRFLSGELSVQDFEKWIYAAPELEKYLGKDDFYSLLCFDFRQSIVQYEVSKFIYNHIDSGRYHSWNIKRLLNKLLDGSQDAVDVFEELYNLYWNKYEFLYSIAIQYATGIDDIPKIEEQDYWEENAFLLRRNALDEFVNSLLPRIETVLDGLESGKIKVIDEQKSVVDPDFIRQLEEKPWAKQMMFGPKPS